MIKLEGFLLVFGLLLIEIEPGYMPTKPTKGSPWPFPKNIDFYEENLIIIPELLTFKVDPPARFCKIIYEAITRYHNIISKSVRELKGSQRYFKYPFSDRTNVYGQLEVLEIQFNGECESTPYFQMVEDYQLEINSPTTPNQAVLSSRSVWGILRGLETFSQLIYPSYNGGSLNLLIRSTLIDDSPRFPHRGLLIDTSRHYLPIKTIKTILDAMEYNKMNVLHWHIVDDQSFPYQSQHFPELSEKGAYDSNIFIYTTTDILNIIDHASLRGIRVIPEFDTPGHTLSWGQGQPNLLTKCYNMGVKYGPIDPTNEYNYHFLKELFNEVLSIFPDKYLHLGGDEVNFNCWASNPNIRGFMRAHNLSYNYKALQSYFIRRIVNIVQNELNTNTLVWQEVFDDGLQLPTESRSRVVVHVWKGGHEYEMSKVTRAGYNAILSSCWYLDHIQTGGDWEKYYSCEPQSFKGTDKQKELVLGGEACMWGELVDETNIIQRIWPRASATAEKLWSHGPAENINLAETAQRIEEHTCRMRRRGIPAQPPNGPGFCVI